MTFTASKERKRRIKPMAEGKVLMPSAAVREWYSEEIKSILRKMADEYRSEIGILMKSSGTKQHFAADANLPVSRFKGLMNRLKEKWSKRANELAAKIAESFVMKVDKHSFSSVGSSLKALGIQEPRGVPKTKWETQIETYVAENIALIKSIPEEFHSKIERATWNSLTSPEGTEQGAYGINGAIRDAMGKGFDRADFIAQDQTSKLNSVMNNARMEQNGISVFEWMHSSAGKTPRKCHQAWNGRYFLTKGGPTDLVELLPDGSTVKYEEGQDGARKGDVAKPGHAPRCRCRAKPVIKLD